MATGTMSFYANGMKNLIAGANQVNLTVDTLKAMLTTSSYTPNMGTHDFVDDVTNEVTGTGYTAGGQTIAGVTATITAANSFATTWAASTAYSVGDIVRPTVANTFLYRCVVAGTSSSSQPTWPTTKGLNVTDGGVTWLCAGGYLLAITCTNPSWTTSTITNAFYAVVYKDTGTPATSPLVALNTFSGNVSSSAGTLSINLNGTLGLFYETF